ncbi:MAG: PaREP1 family protein [Pyrobaculum sp.]
MAKPWRDLARYKEARLREALVEAQLASEFLEEGLVRNAAGKAFQAWKAYMGYLLADHREELKAVFPGSRRIRVGDEEAEVEDVDVVISLVPTSRMAQLAAFLAERGVEGAAEATALALQLHRYQYNGPDP